MDARKGRGGGGEGEGGKRRGHGGRHSKTAPPPGCKWPTKSRPAILWGVWMASKGAPRFKSLAQFCLVFSKANKAVRCATCASKEGSWHDFFGVPFTLQTFSLHSHYTRISFHSHYTHISLHSHYTHISFQKFCNFSFVGGGGGMGLPWEHNGTQTNSGQHESSTQQVKFPPMNSKCKCEKIMGVLFFWFTAHDKNWVIENCPYQRSKQTNKRNKTMCVFKTLLFWVRKIVFSFW
jgi:hypothetical protein